MSDLISKSALLEEMKRMQMDIVAKATAIKTINWQPTVEAKPVVHGRWIGIEDDEMNDVSFVCSVCDLENEEKTDFCPNCGADMRGKKND